ncbi:MAG: pseudouridine synthase [Alphaproteobacteria bacterium]|nr:pseudouridine synthase [Alphaproteobacteria bacterium]
MSEPTSRSGERIAKFLARAGVCSRRDAEKLVLAGRVKVNGQILTSPAFNVDDSAFVLVDGKPVAEKPATRLWRYHKPAGLVTTHRDEKGRETVFAHLPKDLPRVISIGRLDINSEGLLLLTNDGALARQLESPALGWLRRYRVRLGGTVDQEMLNTLASGVTVEGVRYGPVEALLEHTRGHNSWAMIGIREGKNREVKKLMGHLGLNVSRLIRISYGPFQLGSLEAGAVAEIPMKVVREQLGGAAPAKDKPRRAARPAR